MTKLYEIAERYRNIQDLTDNPDIPIEVIEEGLNSITDEFNVKAENIAKVLKEMEYDIIALKEEEDRLLKRRKALENRHQELRLYLEAYMRLIDKPSVVGNIFTLSITKNPPKVQIDDLEGIPKEYINIEEVKKVDKRKILKDLQEGKEVKGVRLEQIESLRIK